MNLEIPEGFLRDAIKCAVQDQLQNRLDDIKLFNVKEAARHLSITPATLRKMSVDTIDFGGRNTRWSISDLQKLIESKRVKSRKFSRKLAFDGQPHMGGLSR